MRTADPHAPDRLPDRPRHIALKKPCHLPLKFTPTHEGALIQVFTQQLREESTGSDFLYLHFAGETPCLSAS